MIRSEAAGAAVLAALYLAVFILAESWARLARPGPEWPRKAVHVGCGLLSLALPGLVHSPWTVAGLAAAFAGLCLAGGRLGFLRCLDAGRPSLGSELYPVSILLVFVLAGGRSWLYAGSILTLALADAGAAMIGMAYGRRRYRIIDADRSLEGSLAFLGLAFLSMLLPMAWLGGFGWGRSALSAGAAALLVTGIEAVSPRGSDNLLVPLGVCILLPWLAALGPR